MPHLFQTQTAAHPQQAYLRLQILQFFPALSFIKCLTSLGKMKVINISTLRGGASRTADRMYL